MKIAIVGAGIVGITTAYELACDGHDVTVFERRGAACEETSFANAGVIAPALVTPWAAPGLPGKAFRALLSQYAPTKMTTPLGRNGLAWAWHWWRHSGTKKFIASQGQLLDLAFYSQRRLHQITGALGLDYERSEGYLVLLRSEKDHKQLKLNMQLMRDAGVVFQELNAEQARKIEPTLSSDTVLSSALHFPSAEVANCRQFAMLIKKTAELRGVRFLYNSNVLPFNSVSPSTLSYLARGGSQPLTHQFDTVVLCAGLASATLLRPLPMHIPINAVYGHTLSAAVREPLDAPRSAVLDQRRQISISRIGNRVRVSGSFEIGGMLGQNREPALLPLYKALQDWYPGAVQMNNVQTWKGATPMLPDGLPLIGASGVPGLWLNTAHGMHGWALSCGSAKVLADLIANRKPDINLASLGMERLRH